MQLHRTAQASPTTLFPFTQVLTESWYARGPLVSLQFSRTKMGITAQQLLFAFEDGTLLALDSRQIDPRRRKMRPVPVKGKMPPPVSPVLPTPPTSMLTMDKRVGFRAGLWVQVRL